MRPDGMLFTRKFSGTLSNVPRKLDESVPLLPVSSQAFAAASAVEVAILFHWVPVLYQKLCVVSSYTSKPFVGGMARRAAVFIRGMRMPLLFDFTSRMALTSAEEPSVLTAKFCAFVKRLSSKPTAALKIIFFIELNV